MGDVGIPDVAQRYQGISKEKLAEMLFESINNKIKPLDDNITVYPGHGAGSACGKNMMRVTVDTLANQKKVNYSLNGKFSKIDFAKELVKDLPEPPAYFPQNVKLNRDGYVGIDKILKNNLKNLTADYVYNKDKSELINGKFKSSKNIPLSKIDSHKKIDKNLTSYVYCAGGYRSVIACSILKRDKFNQLVNVESGFSGISKLI